MQLKIGTVYAVETEYETYIGTYQHEGGLFVYHLFEKHND
jgi:hypothetical protein